MKGINQGIFYACVTCGQGYILGISVVMKEVNFVLVLMFTQLIAFHSYIPFLVNVWIAFSLYYNIMSLNQCIYNDCGFLVDLFEVFSLIYN